MKFPPPPEPPTGSEEFLHSLADYYRSLVEYHQRAATAAAQQFAHLKALLHPERRLDFPTDVPYQLAAEAETEPERPSPVQLPATAEAIPEQSHPFPDLVAPAPPSRYPVRKVLPDSEKLDRYGTLKKAIAACLEEHSPESMTIQQIIGWFYAEGVPEAIRTKVYNSIAAALSEGCNRLGWQRVSTGHYVWKGLGK